MRADRGYWCLPEVDLGLPLTDGMKAVVTARLPRAAAADAMMTGRRYGAADALARGIVEHTAPEAEVLDRAVALAAEIAPKNRSVIAAHKRLLFGDAARVLRLARELTRGRRPHVMIRLYYASGSPFAWRVHLALEEKGLAYEPTLLSFQSGDLKTPEYLAINPHGKVPSITDGALSLYESQAIVEYLEDKYPRSRCCRGSRRLAPSCAWKSSSASCISPRRSSRSRVRRSSRRPTSATRKRSPRRARSCVDCLRRSKRVPPTTAASMCAAKDSRAPT